MMRKIFYSLFFLVLLNTFTLTVVFSDQIAITIDGKKVLLKESGSWEYIKEDADKLEIIAVDKEVKESLHYYIYNHPNMFAEEFHMGVGVLSHLPYDEQYKSIMEMFYKFHYKERHPEEFYSVLVRKFGRKAADNMRWLFEQWEFWEKFCK